MDFAALIALAAAAWFAVPKLLLPKQHRLTPLAGAAALLVAAACAASTARGVLASAAALWTIGDLARPGWRALLGAIAAVVLSPASVVLLALAGLRARARLVPLVAAVLAVIAVIAGAASDGVLGELGVAWFGSESSTAALSVASAIDQLGPLLVAPAALGAVLVARRPATHAGLGLLITLAASLLVDMRAGATGALTHASAATCAALACAQLGALISAALPHGRAIVTACGCAVIAIAAFAERVGA